MKVITAQELKAKLDRGDDIRLIMALDRQAYDRMHIPGSLHFEDVEEAVKQLDPHDEVIVYCSNPLCSASVHAYMLLRSRGFTNLYRFAGGLDAWSKAGYPLEGSLMPEKVF